MEGSVAAHSASGTQAAPRSQHGSQPSTIAQSAAPSPLLSASLGRYSLTVTLALALVGVAIGTALSTWKPASKGTKEVTLQWLGLVGDIFIRCLKAIVLPMVFVNASVAVVDMMKVGRVSSVGLTTVGLYLGTTTVAAGLGFGFIIAFSPAIQRLTPNQDSNNAQVTLGCSEAGFLMQEQPDGTIRCTNSTAGIANSTFAVNDLNSTFARAAASGAPDDLTLSDTVYQGIFQKLFTENIFSSFMNGDFAAVVVFSLAFGAALSRVMHDVSGPNFGYLLVLLKEIDVVLMFILDWIISLTPFAVMSLILKAIGSQQNMGESFAQVMYLVLASLLAMVLHSLVVHVALMALVRGTNPFNFLRHLGSAQAMAFASASSAATIPVTLKALAASKVIPEPIAHFVVPLGATINMDGSAIYYSCTCIWLAGINGDNLNIATCFVLIIISTMGSVGTAPVPSTGLALILTAYNTVFNKTGTPAGFELIVAIDWFMDRCITVLNVTGDCAVCALVTHLCPLGFLTRPVTISSRPKDLVSVSVDAAQPQVQAASHHS